MLRFSSVSEIWQGSDGEIYVKARLSKQPGHWERASEVDRLNKAQPLAPHNGPGGSDGRAS